MEILGLWAIGLVIYAIWLFFFPIIVISKMNEMIKLLKRR